MRTNKIWQAAGAVLKILSLAVMIIAGFVGIRYFKGSIPTMLAFACFLVFYVLIPGRLILDNLRYQGLRFSTMLSRSFFIGFALNVLLYYITVLIGTDVLLYAVGPLLSVLWIFQYVKKSGSNKSFRNAVGVVFRAPASFYVFAALVFLYSIMTTQYTYISPAHAMYSTINLDFGYHCGIVNALAQGYPPLDPWINGYGIEYHFFTEMLYAIPVRLFGLASENIIMMCTPYIITPVLGLSLYSFYMESVSRKNRAGLYCLATILANMFMLKGFSNSWFLYHILSNINNAGMGVACLLVLLPMLQQWDNEPAALTANPQRASRRRFNTRDTLLLAMMVVLCTGIKGPVAIVLVSGMVGTLILGAILRKVSLRNAAAVVLSTIAFILIYVFVIGAQHSNASGGSLINPWEVTDLFYIKEDVLSYFASYPRILALAGLFLVFIVFFFTAFILPFFIGYVRELCLVISGRKDFLFSRVTVYACALVGFLGMMIFDFSGHSQVYFGFVTCILVPVIAFWFFEDLRANKGLLMMLVRALFVVGLCAAAATTMIYLDRGAESALNYYMEHNADKTHYRNVSTEEYEGLLWLRDNTPVDSLIASDRYYSVALDKYDYTVNKHNYHFAYAIYSQRRQYLEGTGFTLTASDADTELRRKMIETNDQLHDPENAGRGDLARDLGVDYVVVSKRFNPAVDLANEDYVLRFTNREMDIYEVLP
ncbi:MAG: hypothetical protein IJH91_05610 [Mogibacterium sp.]|nr:hypothetical protein [Mogibacterium sp.]